MKTRYVAIGLAVVIGGAALVALNRNGRCGPYDLVYDGYGSAHCQAGTVTLSPMVSTAADETHAGLVVVGQSTEGTVGATILTTHQLREGEPNPWEVGWFLFRYQDPDHFYAVVLKPNGWEVSKQDPAYEGKQRFLASGAEPTFAVGDTHTVSVTQNGNSFRVFANGEYLASFTDTETPYMEGKVALYTEDATVTFSGFDAHTASVDGVQEK